METVTTSPRVKRPLQPFSKARLERFRLRIPLVDLAATSGIPLVTLSEAERGLRHLTAEQERARRDALEKLAVGDTEPGHEAPVESRGR